MSENGNDGQSHGEVLEVLHRVFDGAVDAIISISENGQIIQANRACEAVLLYSPEELLGKDVAVIIPTAERNSHQSYVDAYLRTGVASVIGRGREVEAVRSDGTRVLVQLSISEMRIEGQRVFTGFLRDQSPVQSARAMLASVVENAVDGIITIDTLGTIFTANSACSKIFGYETEEMLGRNVTLLMPEPYHGEHAGYLKRYLETGEKRIIGVGREVAGIRKDGTEFPLDLSVAEFTSHGDRFFTGIVRDISERKDTERRLIEREALAKLGEMSTMVAHEIKNPLTGILGATRRLRDRLVERSVEREICEEMIFRTVSLNESVKDILSYARPRLPQPRVVPAEFLLEDMASFVGRDPQFAEIEVEVISDGSQVAADVEMLKSVLLNVLVNSAQALSGKGHIELRAHAGDAPDRCIIACIDDGPGIPPETLEKVLDPFFTTKGAGTGLGLSIAKRIIELQQGTLLIESPPGGGARVTLDLPSVIEK